jgi:hypothetical protein
MEYIFLNSKPGEKRHLSGSVKLGPLSDGIHVIDILL